MIGTAKLLDILKVLHTIDRLMRSQRPWELVDIGMAEGIVQCLAVALDIASAAAGCECQAAMEPVFLELKKVLVQHGFDGDSCAGSFGRNVYHYYRAGRPPTVQAPGAPRLAVCVWSFNWGWRRRDLRRLFWLAGSDQGVQLLVTCLGVAGSVAAALQCLNQAASDAGHQGFVLAEVIKVEMRVARETKRLYIFTRDPTGMRGT